MSRITASTALAALAVMLPGCAADQIGLDTNASVYPLHQPVVQRTEYALDLAADGNFLPAAEQQRLTAWFESLRLDYGDTVYIVSPYGGDSVPEDIRGLVNSYGLVPAKGGSNPGDGSPPPGYIRVIVSRASATVPGCPDYRFAETPGGQVSTPSNFGCATNTNLAAMVADPNDLVLGQPGTPTSDTATASKALKTYRETPPTGAGGLKAVSTKGSN